MSDALLAFGRGPALQQWAIDCQVWSAVCELLLVARRVLFSGAYTSTGGQVNLRNQL